MDLVFKCQNPGDSDSFKFELQHHVDPRHNIRLSNRHFHFELCKHETEEWVSKSIAISFTHVVVWSLK